MAGTADQRRQCSTPRPATSPSTGVRLTISKGVSLITPRNYARRLLNPLRRRAPDKKQRRVINDEAPLSLSLSLAYSFSLRDKERDIKIDRQRERGERKRERERKQRYVFTPGKINGLSMIAHFFDFCEFSSQCAVTARLPPRMEFHGCSRMLPPSALDLFPIYEVARYRYR